MRKKGPNLCQQNCDPFDGNNDCTSGFESQPFAATDGRFQRINLEGGNAMTDKTRKQVGPCPERCTIEAIDRTHVSADRPLPWPSPARLRLDSCQVASTVELRQQQVE
jgi:hypothetical protein